MSTENDETTYTYNDEYKRPFVRQSTQGGRCAALNKYYKSTISDKLLNITSKELNVNGNICEILDECFEYTNKHRKIMENEYDPQFDDYRDINQEDKEKYVNDKLNKLTILKKWQKLNLNDVMMDFDGTSLYPSAMWDEKSVYLKIKTEFVFQPHMNNDYLEAFNNQNFTQNGNESAILKLKSYYPPNLIIQHLPVKEKVKNIEVKGMRNGFIIDTLTWVDICGIIKMGETVIEFYEGVIYRENFK